MHSLRFFSLIACIVFFFSCQTHPSPHTAYAPVDSLPSVAQDFFMLHDKPLPDQIDLSQDISSLNYQNLRLLRSYLYALHGHWFMEGDLNDFFSTHTSWYTQRCYDTWDHSTPPVSASDSLKERYLTALYENYDSSYDYIQLSDTERAFVEKIDSLMSQQEKKKYIPYKEEVSLVNPRLAINFYQIYQPDSALVGHLTRTNIAFQNTTYEQLFQVYENNDYLMLPSFITTDLLLQVTHQYFSYVLKTVERHKFAFQLKAMLETLYTQSLPLLQAHPDNAAFTTAAENVAVFFAVAYHLISPEKVFFMPERIQQAVNDECARIAALTDDFSTLFSSEKLFAYSLFRPRGHYAANESDQQYFRTMMWLQKGCWWRESSASMETALFLAAFLNDQPLPKNTLYTINRALSFLVGQSDNASILELADILKKENITSPLEAISPTHRTDLEKTIETLCHDHNRIAPQVKEGNQDEFNLLPQRYTLDGEMLSLLYDATPNALCAYPSGLDVMYTLGNFTAKSILDTLTNPLVNCPRYIQNRNHFVEDVLPSYKWEGSYYDKWLDDLRTLQRPQKASLGFLHTPEWALKNLNTALAAWALLKHDAILYAEQPMAAECGSGGDFPDPDIVGYVEPNVPFWTKLQETIRMNRELLSDLQLLSEDLEEKSIRLNEFVTFCLRVSQAEIAHKPLSSNDFSEIRHFGSAIEWYTLSILDPDITPADWNSVTGIDRRVAQVADVFTRNVTGCDKDGILYEATGDANAIYVLVEINNMIYLTRGATYSYYEFVRPINDRLSDKEWQEMLDNHTAPAPPSWFAPLLINHTPDHDQRFIYSTGC